MTTLTTDLYCDDIPFEIEYTFSPGCPATLYDPPEADEVEVLSISLFGVKLTDEQEGKFTREYGESHIEEFLFEDLRNQTIEHEYDKAEYRYETMREIY